jgi:hypothetical protein
MKEAVMLGMQLRWGNKKCKQNFYAEASWKATTKETKEIGQCHIFLSLFNDDLASTEFIYIYI